MELKMIKIWRQSAEACQSSGAEEMEEKPNIRYLLCCSFYHFGLGLGGGGLFPLLFKACDLNVVALGRKEEEICIFISLQTSRNKLLSIPC